MMIKVMCIIVIKIKIISTIVITIKIMYYSNCDSDDVLQ